MRPSVLLLLSAGLTGCQTLSPAGLGPTIGERAAAHGYVPVDPLPIEQVTDAGTCLDAGAAKALPLLNALPDVTIRFAVAEFDANGGLNFGPAKVTSANGSYRAVLDYINADNVPIDFYIRRTVARANEIDRQEPASRPLKSGDVVIGYEARIAPQFLQSEVRLDKRINRSSDTERNRYDIDDFVEKEKEKLESNGFGAVTIPIYVGVGLRLSADIRASKGGIGLTGLSSIGAGAEAKYLTGTLAVQTLGINGKAIATTLPLPNKLDQTTVENAVLAIGGARAIIYTASDANDGARTTPRVVGLYSPVGSDPRLISAVYSELSRVRPKWRKPCQPA